MALLQYFRSVPKEHLPLPGQSLVSAKGLIFVARKFNPRIITVIQPKRPTRKFSPAKNIHYTVYSLPCALKCICKYSLGGTALSQCGGLLGSHETAAARLWPHHCNHFFRRPQDCSSATAPTQPLSQAAVRPQLHHSPNVATVTYIIW